MEDHAPQQGLSAESILSAEEETEVMKAITMAESMTSGEVRVHLSNNHKVYTMSDVMKLFKELQMHKTADRNAVLIYVAVKRRTLSIVADKGIYEQVDHDFWEVTKENILSHFKMGKYAEGLISGIIEIGERLKTYFPTRLDNKNELPNDISRS